MPTEQMSGVTPLVSLPPIPSLNNTFGALLLGASIGLVYAYTPCSLYFLLIPSQTLRVDVASSVSIFYFVPYGRPPPQEPGEFRQMVIGQCSDIILF